MTSRLWGTLRRTVTTRHIAVLSILPFLSACASVSQGAGPALAGCYQFQYDGGAKALGLPWGVVLRDEPLAGDWPMAASTPGVMQAETATSPTAREDHPFGYWRRMPSDSVELGYPGGGGLTLTLAPAGPDLVGAGLEVGDALRPGEPAGPRPARAVVARRVLCGAS